MSGQDLSRHQTHLNPYPFRTHVHEITRDIVKQPNSTGRGDFAPRAALLSRMRASEWTCSVRRGDWSASRPVTEIRDSRSVFLSFTLSLVLPVAVSCRSPYTYDQRTDEWTSETHGVSQGKLVLVLQAGRVSVRRQRRSRAHDRHFPFGLTRLWVNIRAFQSSCSSFLLTKSRPEMSYAGWRGERGQLESLSWLRTTRTLLFLRVVRVERSIRSLGR